MAHRIVLSLLFLGMLVLYGCKGEGAVGGMTTQGTVQMTLSANPENPKTDENLSFTLTVNAPEPIIQTRIDFENDGVWDVTRSHNTTTLVDTFTHSYPSVGSRTATAEILLSDQATEVRATTLNVVGPPPRTVEYTLSVEASDAGGVCYVVGHPYTWPGTSLSLGSSFTSNRKTLGLFDPGSTVSILQSFRQDAYAFNGLLFDYSCNFEVRLYIGQFMLGQGDCWTTSIGAQELQCTVSVQAAVL